MEKVWTSCGDWDKVLLRRKGGGGRSRGQCIYYFAWRFVRKLLKLHSRIHCWNDKYSFTGLSHLLNVSLISSRKLFGKNYSLFVHKLFSPWEDHFASVKNVVSKENKRKTIIKREDAISSRNMETKPSSRSSKFFASTLIKLAVNLIYARMVVKSILERNW